MTKRRLPASLLFLTAALFTALDLYKALSAYPALPERLAGDLGKPIALFVPILSCVVWILLLLASFRARRLILPLPFGEAAMTAAREALRDMLSLMAVISAAGFFTAERLLLNGDAIPGWLYALFFFVMLLAAAYFAYAVLRIAKKHGIREREVTEAEAEAAWNDFVKSKK